MAKVVGLDQLVIKRITCKECASIIEYSKGEVRNLWNVKDYSGGSDGADGFSCPNCGKDVIVNRW